MPEIVIALVAGLALFRKHHSRRETKGGGAKVGACHVVQDGSLVVKLGQVVDTLHFCSKPDVVIALTAGLALFRKYQLRG